VASEVERLVRLRRILARARPGITLGIGDDAAVVEAAAPLAVSVDALVEGTHFRRAWLSFHDLGYKATMAALSDLAAMGAEPLAVLAALTLPDDVADADLEAIARGQAEACDEAGTSVAGGNLARGPLSITTTVLGSAPRALRRDGARPGDVLLLAGELGLAAAAVRAFLADAEPPPAADAAWRRPRARLTEGRRAAAVAHAAIDVSDGLALDASRLAEASRVAVVFDAAALVSPALGDAALDLALHGGEDYALLVAAPAGTVLEGFRTVGRCHESARPEVWLETAGGRQEVAPTGYDHFGGR
jgi:thiamine-monophosphate kinase